MLTSKNNCNISTRHSEQEKYLIKLTCPYLDKRIIYFTCMDHKLTWPKEEDYEASYLFKYFSASRLESFSTWSKVILCFSTCNENSKLLLMFRRSATWPLKSLAG